MKPQILNDMICNNPIFQGASGKAGNNLYRQYNGRTFVSKMPRKPDLAKRTKAQHRTTKNFTIASKIAKDRSRDPLLRPQYIALAKAKNLPNAYTAALMEQMQEAKEMKKLAADKRREKLKAKRRVDFVVAEEQGILRESEKPVEMPSRQTAKISPIVPTTTMKNSFKKALRYFKYASLLFVAAYCIYIAVDDYVLFRHITTHSDFWDFISFQSLFLVQYFIVFSGYFWIVALVVIFISHKYLIRTAKTLALLPLLLMISCTNTTKDKSSAGDRSLRDPEHAIKDGQEDTKFDSTMLYTGWYYVVDADNGYGRQLDKSTKTYFIERKPILTAKNVISLEVYESAGEKKYFGLAMRLDEEGTNNWRIATKKSIGKELAFIVDNKLLEVADVNAEISNGMTVLNRGDYSKEELENFSTIIESEE